MGYSFYQTDTDISKRELQERELTKWEGDGQSLGDHGSDTRNWDQFATHARMTKRTQKEFDLCDYSTELDKKSAFYLQNEAQAKKIAAQILGKSASSVHAAMDRGEDSNMCEEDLFSGVLNRDGDSKYVPPYRRSEKAAKEETPEWATEPAKAEPVPAATTTTAAASEPAAAAAAAASAKDAKPKPKSKLNPKAKAFSLSAKAKSFVPTFGAPAAAAPAPVPVSVPVPAQQPNFNPPPGMQQQQGWQQPQPQMQMAYQPNGQPVAYPRGFQQQQRPMPMPMVPVDQQMQQRVQVP